MFNDFPSFNFNFNDNFSPKIDISEDDKNIYLEAEIPGLSKDNLKLTLQDNILTIEGEKKTGGETKEKNYFRSERSYGSFKRSFTLPENVDGDKVAAKFNEGVLEVTIAKLEEKPKSEKVIAIN